MLVVSKRKSRREVEEVISIFATHVQRETIFTFLLRFLKQVITRLSLSITSLMLSFSTTLRKGSTKNLVTSKVSLWLKNFFCFLFDLAIIQYNRQWLTSSERTSASRCLGVLRRSSRPCRCSSWPSRCPPRWWVALPLPTSLRWNVAAALLPPAEDPLVFVTFDPPVLWRLSLFKRELLLFSMHKECCLWQRARR